MKNFILFLLIFLFCYSCAGPKRDVMLITHNYINNNTNHIIKFIPYEKGLIITDSIKVFAPNAITLLESEKSFKPSFISPGFSSRYNRFTDSVIVIFDNIKMEKHISPSKIPLNSLYIPSKERSIYTDFGDAYTEKIIEQRKNYIEIEYTYTFTEQDYLDAEVIK